jgi:hypothetical protein
MIIGVAVMAAVWSFAIQRTDEVTLVRMRESRSTGWPKQGDTHTMWPDSLNVHFVGNWPFGLCEAVAYDSVRSIAFCGSGGGVYVLDLFDPSSPVKLSETIHTRGFVQGLSYQGNRLYIACDVAGLEIWDVTDASSPTRLGFYYIPDNAHDVTVSGIYCYVAAEDSGLRVVNVSDPAHPYEEGFCGTPDQAHSVAVCGSYA